MISCTEGGGWNFEDQAEFVCRDKNKYHTATSSIKFSSLFKKIKNIFVKIVSREYTVGILDILILLVVASIVSSTATGYVMNKEFEKNVLQNYW